MNNILLLDLLNKDFTIYSNLSRIDSKRKTDDKIEVSAIYYSVIDKICDWYHFCYNFKSRHVMEYVILNFNMSHRIFFLICDSARPRIRPRPRGQNIRPRPRPRGSWPRPRPRGSRPRPRPRGSWPR